jgi:hypothetical protein
MSSAGAFGLYWVKTWAGIDLVQGFSISNRWPLKYLVAPRVVQAKPGELLVDETFEAFAPLYRSWPFFSVPQARKPQRSIETADGSGSKYLLVSNVSDQRWVISHRNLIEVKRDDHFTVDAVVRVVTRDGLGGFRITAYDKDKAVVKWNYWHRELPFAADFQKIGGSFVIGEDIAYIRLELVGRGAGEFSFDAIQLTLADRL